MAKADFLTGLVLLALGTYMIVEGLGLPGAGGFIEAGGEPGRVPIMLGAAIACLALVLIVRAARAGGYRLGGGAPLGDDERVGVRRCALTAALCAVYAVGLIGAEIAGWRVAYHQATFVFVFVFIVVFEADSARENAARTHGVLSRAVPGLVRALGDVFAFVPPRAAPYAWLASVALAQAAIVTALVTWLFERQFYVKLP